MKFILGTKVGMAQIFSDKGAVVPVTIVKAEPNVILQVKTKDKDGYQAVQVGTGTKRKLTLAAKGHRKGLGDFRFLREFSIMELNGQELKVGDKIDVTLFEPGDKVKVAGLSKGKGFQGAVKRHGFHGMPASHGHHSVGRHIGSIGQRFPQHTLKGKRMAGHMGFDRKTIRGLKIMVVDAEQQVLAINGAVPGQRGALLEIVSQ